jgi:hypothetical protein
MQLSFCHNKHIIHANASGCTLSTAASGSRRVVEHSGRSGSLTCSAACLHPVSMSEPSHGSTARSGRGFIGWLRQSWGYRGLRSSVAAGSSQDPHTGDPAAQEQQRQPRHQSPESVGVAPTHLIVMVNGLFGSAANWDVMCEQLRQQLPPDTLLHPSNVNAR